MKTIALVQGDFSPAPGGYLLYEGPQKIHQDLTRLWRRFIAARILSAKGEVRARQQRRALAREPSLSFGAGLSR